MNETTTNSNITNLNSNDKSINNLLLEIEAARKIERVWCSHRDRQMFRLLKHSVCAAEHSLSKEILKKISPLESNLLNDPCFNVKIKFRFAGEEFPPYIVFKVFVQTQDGKTAKYINGKNTIKTDSNAAYEACSQMGNRNYYNIIIKDSIQSKSKNKITDLNSVVSIRDYMQYSSMTDELPANMGGRSNCWRRLNLTDLPRHTIFYDVLNYAFTKKMSKNLAKEIPVLLKAPQNSDIQLEHIRIISKIETNEEMASKTSYLNNSNYKLNTPQVTSRRSKNALSKVSKMKKAYGQVRSETLTTESAMQTSERRTESYKIADELNDEFENEVRNLYMWTQNLSLNDDILN